VCYITWVINRGHLSILSHKKEMKKALALSALAALSAASVAPAMAGPYLTTKVGVKGEGSEFDKSYVETRVGYETKMGNLKPYIEVGPAWETGNGEETENFGQLEVGSKIKLTDNLSSKVKAEFTNPFESGTDMEWKYEATLTYDF
jgi:hypothetical protein